MEHLHNSLRNKDKMIIMTLVIIVSLLASILVSINFIIRDIKQTQNEVIRCVKKDRQSQFDMFFDKMEAEALLSASDASREIQDNIINKYGDDMSVLKEQLESDNYTELSDLLSKSIKDKYLNVNSDNNKLFIANNKGIICDYSYSRASYDGEYRHWEDIIYNSYDTSITKAAVEKIINRSKLSIVCQFEDSNVDLSRYGENLDRYTLKNIYQDYGIQALKSFELLVPSYITDDGDIFGQKDIKNGVRHNTYKLIVVQRINLYEQIINEYPGLVDEFTLNEINYKSNNIICSIYLLGLLITVGFVAAVVQFSMIINKYIINPAIEKGKKEEGEDNQAP